MPVPSSISDLSTTPSLNSPAGTESPSTVDDYLRTHAAFIKQVDDSAVKAADLAATGGAALVGFQQAGTGAVATNVQSKLREFVSVKDFGAVGDGVVDDYAPINAALSYIKALGGGTLYFPQGTYKVTDQIVIDSPCIRFVGTGRRKVYPGAFVPSSGTVSTIMPVHSKRSAIRFYSETINTASTFTAEGINLATLETGAMPLVGFGWDGSGSFHRDYTFTRVGVHGFTSAFETYGTGGIGSFGLLKITDCSINRNNYIIRNLDGTAWNGFVFEKNEAGQNITGGISVRAQSCSIKNNALEGQPNAIKVFGNYNGVVISENYFEANTGAYCVWLQETLNAYVGNNFWLNINSTEALKLENDIGTTVDDRIIPTCYGSVDLRSKEHAINPVPQGFGSAALIIDPSMITNVLNGYAEFGDYKVTSADGPLYGIPDSAGGLFTTSGTGLTQATKLGLSIPSGTYIGVAFVISYDDMPVLPPTFALRVNSQAGQGYHAPIFYGLDKVTQKVKGKTVLYYGVVKALADVSSFQLYIYPFGISPAAGLKCYLSAYAMYNLGTNLPSVDQVGSYVNAEIPAMHVQRVTSPPTVGTWPAGYKLNARSPAAGGFEGWICTTAGTPGTWKTFGAISA